jgi:ABC-2 type transport system permease protein
MLERIKQVFSYSDMVGSLVKRELRGKYKGSALGFLWTFINPLCQILVYTVVFSVIVRSNLDNFYVYMIVGMIPWLFFDMSLRQGAGCIRYQGDMLKKIYFPREVLPITTVTANFVNMLFCFIIVFAVIFISGIGISFKALLFLPLIMGIEYIMALGFALIVSAWTVYFKDLEHIISVVLMAWIYGTPIMYSLDSVPVSIKWLFKLNPMTSVIQSYHRILYAKMLPSAKDLLYAAVFAIVLLIIGEIIFAKLDDNFAEEL